MYDFNVQTPQFIALAPIYGLAADELVVIADDVKIDYIPITLWLEIEKESLTLDRNIQSCYEKNEPLWIIIESGSLDKDQDFENFIIQSTERIRLVSAALRLACDMNFFNPALIAQYFLDIDTNYAKHTVRKLGPNRQMFYMPETEFTVEPFDKHNQLIAKDYLNQLWNLQSIKCFDKDFLLETILHFTASISHSYEQCLFDVMVCFEFLEAVMGRTHKTKFSLCFAQRLAMIRHSDQTKQEEDAEFIQTKILSIRNNIMHGDRSVDQNIINDINRFKSMCLATTRQLVTFLGNAEPNKHKSMKAYYSDFQSNYI